MFGDEDGIFLQGSNVDMSIQFISCIQMNSKHTQTLNGWIVHLHWYTISKKMCFLNKNDFLWRVNDDNRNNVKTSTIILLAN